LLTSGYFTRKPPPIDRPPPETDLDIKLEGRPHDLSVAIVELGEQSLMDRVVKELFSLFILAVAENVEAITGQTVSRADPRMGVDDEAYPRFWENTVFEHLADIAVEAEITTSKSEARALVIPAFAWYGLLPTEETPATVEPPSRRQ
jgi:hypothetical protein